LRSSVSHYLVSLTLLALLPVAAAAQLTELRLPMSLDAESTSYDGKNSMLMFTGLRLTQGSIGIEADEGRASKLDFEDSTWQFSGNVVIDVENGHIECDAANLEFTDFQLRVATVTGSPATFELKRAGSDEVTYAEAGKLTYDVAAGVVEFSGDATITEGGNQIASSYLVYNIPEQRISAQSSGDDDSRVRITYTPVDAAPGTGPTEAPPEAPVEAPAGTPDDDPLSDPEDENR
jgi:lipopolysaccharide export system protein LptA